jgi:hypothetical protein
MNNPQFQLGVCKHQRIVNPVRVVLKLETGGYLWATLTGLSNDGIFNPQLKLGVIHGVPLQGFCYYLQHDENTRYTYNQLNSYFYFTPQKFIFSCGMVTGVIGFRSESF